MGPEEIQALVAAAVSKEMESVKKVVAELKVETENLKKKTSNSVRLSNS